MLGMGGSRNSSEVRELQFGFTCFCHERPGEGLFRPSVCDVTPTLNVTHGIKNAF